jgi:hypothetical protein
MQINKDNNSVRTVKEVQGSVTLLKQPLRRSLLAKRLLIKGENMRQFEEMRLKILSEIEPHTEIENILCEKIISALWKIQRAMEIEKNLLNMQNKIRDEEMYDFAYDSTSRKRIRNIKKIRISNEEVQQVIQYQLELEKGMQKAFERLREEQLLRIKQHKHP